MNTYATRGGFFCEARFYRRVQTKNVSVASPFGPGCPLLCGDMANRPNISTLDYSKLRFRIFFLTRAVSAFLSGLLAALDDVGRSACAPVHQGRGPRLQAVRCPCAFGFARVGSRLLSLLHAAVAQLCTCAGSCPPELVSREQLFHAAPLTCLPARFPRPQHQQWPAEPVHPHLVGEDSGP